MSRTVLLRLLKFSAVGGIGVGVQLGMLALFRVMGINFLPATALAVECAVLHNFLWHCYFTWSDRKPQRVSDFRSSLIRFHLSNGLISLVGNLLLMWILMRNSKLGLLQANTVSIATCYVANFLAGDRWVFRLS
jgi:putative flippase GtrA